MKSFQIIQVSLFNLDECSHFLKLGSHKMESQSHKRWWAHNRGLNIHTRKKVLSREVCLVEGQGNLSLKLLVKEELNIWEEEFFLALELATIVMFIHSLISVMELLLMMKKLAIFCLILLLDLEHKLHPHPINFSLYSFLHHLQ